MASCIFCGSPNAENPVCPRCQQKIDTAASARPWGLRAILKAGAATVAVLFVVALCVGANDAGNRPAPPGAPSLTTYDRASIVVACESAVRDMLKAPSTATFQSSLEGRWIVPDSAGGQVTYSNTVDAQNSFGAMLRNRFVCSAARTADGSDWQLVQPPTIF